MEYEHGKLYRTTVNLNGFCMEYLEEIQLRMPLRTEGFRHRGVSRSTAIENAVAYYLRYLRSLENDKRRGR